MSQTLALGGVHELAVDVAQDILLDGGEVEVREVEQDTLDGDRKVIIAIGKHPVQFVFAEDGSIDFGSFTVRFPE